MRPRGTAEELEVRRKKAIALVEKEGLSQAEAARKLRVSGRAVRLWLQWHRGRGGKPRPIEALPTPGRPSRLDEKQRDRLRKLLKAGPRSVGFDGDLWNSRWLRDLIRKEFRVSYHLNHLPRLVRKYGFSDLVALRGRGGGGAKKTAARAGAKKVAKKGARKATRGVKAGTVRRAKRKA
jgi:transposase